MSTQHIEQKHISVLLHELVDAIDTPDTQKNIIVDATLGMAGHAVKMLEKMNPGDIFIGFDADERNLTLAQKVLEEANKNKNIEIILIHSNFVSLQEELVNRGIHYITGIYYDLGLSSLHLDEAERGFSFMHDGPLDMRLDASTGKTAAEVINGYTQADLRKIFLEYGEEPGANKISAKISQRRKEKKFSTTLDLAEVIPGPPKVKAKIFQAIRIEVNSEIQNIKKSLQQAIQLLQAGGNIFIISFHSGEDKVVKHLLKQESKDCICSDIICSCNHTKQVKIITKKPIIPTDQEIKENPRSRSAKARHAQKI